MRLEQDQIDIWLDMFNRYSYSEYTEMCSARNVNPMLISDFAKFTGTVGVALAEHRNMQAMEACNLIKGNVVATPISKSAGFGDTVAKMTSAIGIKPCGGCKQRQAKLNEWFPYE